MQKAISWVWPLLGLVACGGGGAQTGDPEVDVTSGDDPTASSYDESSGGSLESSGPSSVSEGESGSSESAEPTSADATGESGEPTSEGSEGSTGEPASVCGDDICDADENEASCCADCGCAEGSSCVDAACTPDPFCGDAACNGTETMEDCCVDCGCADGSACQDEACVVLPVCGDGACNGTETIDDCCNDCGCGENYTCEDNACACTDAIVHFENVMPDFEQYCFATNSWYTQESVGYINMGTGWIYMPDGGYTEFPGTLGGSVDGTEQCCLLDACGGNQVCPTPFGNYPCFCADPVPLSGSVDVCGENFVAVCD